MSNYVFKQFCSELDAQSLGNLLDIVATPNERAADMVEGDNSDDDGNESGGEVQDESEISDDSDDL